MENIEQSMTGTSDRKTIDSGTHWFYWIAALSAVNSLIVFYVGTQNSAFAFGVTQWLDGTRGPLTAEGWHPPLHVPGLIINLAIAAGFAALGYFARRNDMLFLFGLFLYSVDALLSLGLKEFFGFAFHFVGLFYMFRGLLASRHLRENATTH